MTETNTDTSTETKPLDGMGYGKFCLEVTWIAIRLLLVYYLGDKGAVFFYQNF